MIYTFFISSSFLNKISIETLDIYEQQNKGDKNEKNNCN